VTRLKLTFYLLTPSHILFKQHTYIYIYICTRTLRSLVQCDFIWSSNSHATYQHDFYEEHRIDQQYDDDRWLVYPIVYVRRHKRAVPFVRDLIVQVQLKNKIENNSDVGVCVLAVWIARIAWRVLLHLRRFWSAPEVSWRTKSVWWSAVCLKPNALFFL